MKNQLRSRRIVYAELFFYRVLIVLSGLHFRRRARGYGWLVSMLVIFWSVDDDVALFTFKGE